MNRPSPTDNLQITFKKINKVETGETLDPLDLIASSTSTKILYPIIDTSTPGIKKLLFIAVGENNYQKEFLKEIEVIDPTPPELVLKKDEVTITVGETFDPTSYVSIAHDNYDGDLKVKISKDYDTKKAGIYHITYEVQDSSSNKVRRTLTLTVIEKEKPADPVVNNPANSGSGNNSTGNTDTSKPNGSVITPPTPSYVGQTEWLVSEWGSFETANAKCDEAGAGSGRRYQCTVMTDGLGIQIGYRLNLK